MSLLLRARFSAFTFGFAAAALGGVVLLRDAVTEGNERLLSQARTAARPNGEVLLPFPLLLHLSLPRRVCVACSPAHARQAKDLEARVAKLEAQSKNSLTQP
jgi:hypothetical protein